MSNPLHTRPTSSLPCLLASSPADGISCRIVKRAVAQYGEAAAEAWARARLFRSRHRACQALPQAVRAPYRIREVDGQDDEIADILGELHRLTFFGGAPIPCFAGGHWWLACRETMPVAFAGVVPSTHLHNAGYFCRVGVLQPHWGHGLQLRLMRAMELRARRNGWRCIVSDTTGNIASANNFIRAGYRLYQPPSPWAFPHTLYWRKRLTPFPS